MPLFLEFVRLVQEVVDLILQFLYDLMPIGQLVYVVLLLLEVPFVFVSQYLVLVFECLNYLLLLFYHHLLLSKLLSEELHLLLLLLDLLDKVLLVLYFPAGGPRPKQTLRVY